MTEINVAELFKTIGGLEAESRERTRQIEVLFKEITKISDNMLTKSDINALVASQMANHTGDCGIETLNTRLVALETDRQAVKMASRIAVGAPAFLIGAVEVAKWFFGHR